MNYLIKDEKLELKYAPGKGAWTYHIQIPNTKHIVGKWGRSKSPEHLMDTPWKLKIYSSTIIKKFP